MSDHFISNATRSTAFASTELLQSSLVLTFIPLTIAFLPSYEPSITESSSQGWLSFLLALLSGYYTPGLTLATAHRVLYGSHRRPLGIQQSGGHQANIHPKHWGSYAATALATIFLILLMTMLGLLGAFAYQPESSNIAYIHFVWYLVKIVVDMMDFTLWLSLPRSPGRSSRLCLESAMAVCDFSNAAVSVLGIWIFATTILPNIERAAFVTFGFVVSRQLTHLLLFFIATTSQVGNLEQERSVYSLTPTRSQHGLPPLSAFSLTPTRSEHGLPPLSGNSSFTSDPFRSVM